MTTALTEPRTVAVRGNGKTRRRRRFRPPNRWALVALPALVLVVLAFVVPVAVMAVSSLTDPGPENYADAVHSGLFRRAITSTFSMAGIVTVLSLLVAYPYAYVMARGGRLIRSILGVSLMISFWTSLLVRTFSWQVLLNDTGVVNEALISLGLRDEPIEMMHTAFAVDLAMVHILAPYLVLALYAQLRTISPDLELAARGMGATPSRAFMRVTLPLSLPGAVAGSVLVFVLALGFYITPQILGASGTSYIGQAIVTQVQTLLKTGVGAAMSMILLAMVLTVLALTSRFVGLQRILGVGQGEGR
jgi:putative spermidine/putrescine transport system permease protein